MGSSPTPRTFRARCTASRERFRTKSSSSSSRRSLGSRGPTRPGCRAQGLFAIPASGGAAQNETDGFLSGYGKGPGLPYDEYAQNGLDFAPYWWDPTTNGPSNGTGDEGKGVGWYADGAKRYKAGTWPKKRFG